MGLEPYAKSGELLSLATAVIQSQEVTSLPQNSDCVAKWEEAVFAFGETIAFRGPQTFAPTHPVPHEEQPRLEEVRENHARTEVPQKIHTRR